MNSDDLKTYLNDIYKDKSDELVQLESVLDLYKIDICRKDWNYYQFNELNIPRVSNILDSTIGKAYLNQWAASLGSRYNAVRNKILNTGTLVHLYIEDFFLHGRKEFHPLIEKKANIREALNCYANFLRWYYDMDKAGFSIKPLLIEKETSTPYYAGTCDFVAQISNNESTMNYIIDFKTSKVISFEYFIQTMFYVIGFEFNRNILGDLSFPEIDGIGILRIDKKEEKYQFVTLDLYSFTDMGIINDLRKCVYQMTEWFYMQNSMKLQINDFLKNHINLDEVLKDVH